MPRVVHISSQCFLRNWFLSATSDGVKEPDLGWPSSLKEQQKHYNRKDCKPTGKMEDKRNECLYLEIHQLDTRVMTQ